MYSIDKYENSIYRSTTVIDEYPNVMNTESTTGCSDKYIFTFNEIKQIGFKVLVFKEQKEVIRFG